MVFLEFTDFASGLPFDHTQKKKSFLEQKNLHERDLSTFDYSFGEIQGDQPLQQEDSGGVKIVLSSFNTSTTANENMTTEEYMRAVRERELQNSQMEERMKDSWIEKLKQTILNKTGHGNSVPKINDTATKLGQINYPDIIKTLQNDDNNSNDDEQVIEKVRSYYPSCEPPRNTDEDLWGNETCLNLHFNISTEESTKIASSFLRLYRFTSNSSENGIVRSTGCDYNDDKLLRVSVYWYTKPLKKNNRVKRRLSDSKVITENAPWVELNIRPALKAWSKGRNKNMGLSITVEDQDDNVLKTIDYFKGPTCMPLPNQFPASYSTHTENPTTMETMMEEPQMKTPRKPFLVTYPCYQL